MKIRLSLTSLFYYEMIGIPGESCVYLRNGNKVFTVQTKNRNVTPFSSVPVSSGSRQDRNK